MKKIFLILIIMFSIMLTACINGKLSEEEIDKQQSNTNLFKMVSRENYGRILVDKETKVMYWESCSGHTYGILTLLVDKNGNPRIWNG